MERRRFHTAAEFKYFSKVLHLLCPQYLPDWFVFAETITRHQGQNKHASIICTTLKFSLQLKKIVSTDYRGVAIFQISRFHLKN